MSHAHVSLNQIQQKIYMYIQLTISYIFGATNSKSSGSSPVGSGGSLRWLKLNLKACNNAKSLLNTCTLESRQSMALLV